MGRDDEGDEADSLALGDTESNVRVRASSGRHRTVRGRVADEDDGEEKTTPATTTTSTMTMADGQGTGVVVGVAAHDGNYDVQGGWVSARRRGLSFLRPSYSALISEREMLEKIEDESIDFSV